MARRSRLDRIIDRRIERAANDGMTSPAITRAAVNSGSLSAIYSGGSSSAYYAMLKLTPAQGEIVHLEDIEIKLTATLQVKTASTSAAAVMGTFMSFSNGTSNVITKALDNILGSTYPTDTHPNTVRRFRLHPLIGVSNGAQIPVVTGYSMKKHRLEYSEEQVEQDKVQPASILSFWCFLAYKDTAVDSVHVSSAAKWRQRTEEI